MWYLFKSKQRLIENAEFPKLAYLETLAMFFAMNFLYHRNFYRVDRKALNFLAFMAVNVFSSFQVAQITNSEVLPFYAAQYNNMMEFDHQNKLVALQRRSLYN